MKSVRALLLPAVASLLTGCFEKVTYSTTYVLKPLVQTISGETAVPLAEAQAFVYGVDTTLWTVASYEDALNGIITSKEDPGERLAAPLSVSEPYSGEGGASHWLQMPIYDASQMVVVVDTADRIYAYTQQASGENLPALYVSVVFKAWKEGNSYKDGQWSFYNEFYSPPVYLDCYIEPWYQDDTESELTEPSSIKAYAYAADTTVWKVASYADASAGVITRKDDPEQQRTNPNFSAYKESGQNLYKMQVSESTLMVVVVDTKNRFYAYSQQEVDLYGEPQTFQVVFRNWQQTWIWVDNGWRVVDERYAPDDTN